MQSHSVVVLAAHILGRSTAMEAIAAREAGVEVWGLPTHRQTSRGLASGPSKKTFWAHCNQQFVLKTDIDFKI